MAELAAQPAAQMLLDGEIVALDEQGLPSFQRLQERMHLTRPADIQRQDALTPVLYYVFDLLYLDGFDLTRVPLAQRKTALAQALLPSSLVRYVDHVDADGEEAYRQSVKLGLEGVVAKRRDGTYEAGKRSRAWLKVKGVLTAEFVVGGYSQGSGERAATFGALLLGYYDDGRLLYAGNVGSGFDQAGLKELQRRLEELRVDRRPFAEEPPLGKTQAHLGAAGPGGGGEVRPVDARRPPARARLPAPARGDRPARGAAPALAPGGGRGRGAVIAPAPGGRIGRRPQPSSKTAARS